MNPPVAGTGPTRSPLSPDPTRPSGSEATSPQQTPPIAEGTTRDADDRAELDAPLRAEVRYLGNELGEVLKRHGSRQLYDLVEEVRAMSKARRSGDLDADARLRDRLSTLSLAELDDLIRALTVFFDLANLAEDRHRTRVLRQRERRGGPEPIGESLAAAIRHLQQGGNDGDAVQAILNDLRIELVFTAHPTEAKRRTVRNTLRRLRDDLSQLQRPDLLDRERQRYTQRIRTNLDCLWETDTLRANRPTVIEEVERSLFVIDSLWETVPVLYRSMRTALSRAYPGRGFDLPVFLSFGSWIGGDRDGNPYVTHAVTAQTLNILRRAAIDRHLEQCRVMRQILSISETRHPVSEAINEALRRAREQWPHARTLIDKVHPREKYRQWLQVIRHRLGATRALNLLGGDRCPLEGAAAYPDVDALLEDLRLIQDSLHANGHHALADGELQEWIDLAAVFGFHLAQLDIREDTRRLRRVAAEIAARIGLIDVDASSAGDIDQGPADSALAAFNALSEADRQALLTTPWTPEQLHAIARLAPPEVLTTDPSPADAARPPEASDSACDLSESALETLRLFELIETVGRVRCGESLGMFITSMTSRASDSLLVLWLSRLAAARLNGSEPAIRLPIVPLFETIDDLENAHETIDALLSCEPYADHVRACDGLQVCMVGYSDSTKDGGYLSGNWSLFRSQERLAQSVRDRGFELMVFHGRGGAIGRGGGPAAHSILSLPPHSVDGRIRITEQGEVLAQRYDDPDIALRHLEQVTYATMLVSTRNEQLEAERSAARAARWDEALDAAAEASRRHYRELIEDPGFLDYFEQATPINAIESLAIGSRPSRRPEGGRQRDLSQLRAIPYTFAWTQNRHMLTGFYGLGTGLDAAARALAHTGPERAPRAQASEGEPDNDPFAAGWALLTDLYEGSAFFRAVIDIAELALVKTDLAIARAYAEGCEDEQTGRRIWRALAHEGDLARHAILRITGRGALLDHVGWLKRSVQVRNPYVDPLNFIQVELMQRRARGLDNPETVREQAHHEQAIEELLRLSIQGIAAGLRTTG